MSCDHVTAETYHVTVAVFALLQNFVKFSVFFLTCRSLTQDSQERSDTAPTERPVASPELADSWSHSWFEAQSECFVSVCGGSVSGDKFRENKDRSV